MIRNILITKKKLLGIVVAFLTLSYTLAFAQSSSHKSLKVYFAGDIFTQKDLIGNLQLSQAIEKLSNNRYKCFMAQNRLQQTVLHKIIKKQDLQGVFSSDIALFAFDGSDIDSGTVVEFMAAKFLDKPAVIYRTDFRGGSGQKTVEDNNKWNLMISFYPRTKVIYINSMIEYQKFYKKYRSESVDFITRKYSEYIARRLIKNMDSVLLEPKLLNGSGYKVIQGSYKKLMGIE
jgi:nucleoside 2-deoxyribosyltransferase